MKLNHQLLLNDKKFKIIQCENEYIVHPIAFGIIPTAQSLSDPFFIGTFQIKGFQLLLLHLNIPSEGLCPVINGVTAKSIETIDGMEFKQYYDINQPLHYTGSITIADDFVKDYSMNDTGQAPCFCYKCILELIFEDGILITTIDHSRDMLRIRKNIELGLRSLSKKRDFRCIEHFIKSTFIGNYKPFSSPKKSKKYLNKMKKQYNKK